MRKLKKNTPGKIDNSKKQAIDFKFEKPSKKKIVCRFLDNRTSLHEHEQKVPDFGKLKVFWKSNFLKTPNLPNIYFFDKQVAD